MSSQRLRVPDDVIHRDLDGEAVILNLKTGTYFGLDAVGTRMWMLIGELGERDKVLEALLAEYEVDGQQLWGDFDGLVAQLVDHGLLELSGESLANGSAD
jgi:Coenzyme PQQ synthesis protein D (PqqD)